MTTATTIHPFEKAELGVAPFRLKGFSREVYQAIPGDPSCPVQPGTSCDYCGNGIMYVAWIGDAQGRTFKVGCDCVAKLGRKDNMEKDPIVVAAAEYRRSIQREQRHGREAIKIQRGESLYNQNRDRFAAIPHPNEYWANQGQTAADYVDWYFANAGNSGKLRIIRYVERIVNQP